MSEVPFRHRSEHFGLARKSSWALPTLRLVCSVPRLYDPLVTAFNRKVPGTRRNLRRLHQMGFLDRQDPIIVDTRTGTVADTPTRAVPRYRTTSRGKRLVARWREDPRCLEDLYPRATPANLYGAGRLLEVLDLDKGSARFGLSATVATSSCGLADRTARWWLRKLVEDGYVTVLPFKLGDVRELVPGHWRPNRMLGYQMKEIVGAYPNVPKTLLVELRLNRARWLEDIDPVRVSLAGSTDYDHDVDTQRVLAALLRSPAMQVDAVWSVEPRFVLTVNKSKQPWQFTKKGKAVIYQPDAELRELDSSGTVVRSVIEYERFQTRRDGWTHIERFCGWLATRSLAFEPAVLRFVVDGPAKVRSYTALIEAFADYALDHPDRCPANPVQLAVADANDLYVAADPLDDRHWVRIDLEPGTGTGCVLHPTDESPYDDYFRGETTPLDDIEVSGEEAAALVGI